MTSIPEDYAAIRDAAHRIQADETAARAWAAEHRPAPAVERAATPLFRSRAEDLRIADERRGK